VTEGEPTKADTLFSVGLWETLKSNSRAFTGELPAQSVAELLADGLRLYAQAMDERFEHQRLLRWWQLAERMTLAANRRGEIDLVVKRLIPFSVLWKLDTVGIEKSLRAIGRMRNSIVHTGVHNMVNADDCYFMQVICETALFWLFSRRKKIKTAGELDAIYDLLVSDRDRFTDLRTAMNNVGGFKKRNA
jgi:hypothetical protein